MTSASLLHGRGANRVAVGGRIAAVACAAACALACACSAHAAIPYTAYVGNYGSGTVTPINTATNTAGAPIAVTEPIAIAIAPDGRTAYVASRAGRVTPINTATNTAGAPISTGVSNQWGIAIAPNGQAAYLGDYAANTLIPINLATNSTGAASKVGAGPVGVAITPDGATAYVSDSADNSLSPVTLASGTVGTAIGIGSTPYPVAITPDQAPVASLSVTARPAGSVSSFDAAASSVAYGSIASYVWSFGDGHTAVTTTPTVTHVYVTAGSYTATLTETDSAGTSISQVFTGQTISRNGSLSAQISRSVAVPASPASPARPAAPAPPTVRILVRSVTVRHGYAVIPLSCPSTAVGGCHGTVTIALAEPRARRASAFAARCARGCRSLSSVNYEARAGQRIRVRVRMASFVRKSLARRKSLRVSVTVTSVAGARTASATAAVTLRAGTRGA
jgi:YVTN family beta-propeller protein